MESKPAESPASKAGWSDPEPAVGIALLAVIAVFAALAALMTFLFGPALLGGIFLVVFTVAVAGMSVTQVVIRSARSIRNALINLASTSTR